MGLPTLSDVGTNGTGSGKIPVETRLTGSLPSSEDIKLTDKDLMLSFGQAEESGFRLDDVARLGRSLYITRGVFTPSVHLAFLDLSQRTAMAHRQKSHERIGCPYVGKMYEDIPGKPAPNALTGGSAGWTFQRAMQFILDERAYGDKAMLGAVLSMSPQELESYLTGDISPKSYQDVIGMAMGMRTHPWALAWTWVVDRVIDTSSETISPESHVKNLIRASELVLDVEMPQISKKFGIGDAVEAAHLINCAGLGSDCARESISEYLATQELSVTDMFKVSSGLIESGKYYKAGLLHRIASSSLELRGNRRMAWHMTKEGINLLGRIDVKSDSARTMRHGLIQHEEMRLIELETGSALDALHELLSVDGVTAADEISGEILSILAPAHFAAITGGAIYAV